MMSRRKILFVSSNFPPVIGGSSVVYDQLCRNAGGEIVALGAARDYRTGEPWPNIDEADRGRDYRIYRLPFLRPSTAGGESTGQLGRLARIVVRDVPIMARALALIAVLIIRYRVQVVCLGELIYGGWLVFPLRYLLGRRVFIYTHGEEIAQDTENLLARRRGLFLKHAHGVIAVSLFCKGQIISKFGIDPNKIDVINNGVDLTDFNRNGKDRCVWPMSIRDRHIILSVSRLVERKGQENLLRAMSLVVTSHPDAHCVIVGGGPLESRLRDLVRELGLQSQCTIIGPAPHNIVVNYFRNCDVFALPCRTLSDGDTEGFGLVFLEAGACGKPVVAGIAGGTIEAVQDEETGLLVDGADIAQIATAITRLLDDTVFSARLGDQAWLRAQGCNWPAVARRFINVCNEPGTLPSVPSYAIRQPAFAPTSAGKSTPELLVTVDVEEEFGWEEFDRSRHTVRGVHAMRQFHLDCRSVGVSPVYLLTYPILISEEYRQFLRHVIRDGEAEAGIHLHSWTVPPYWEQPNAFTSYQCNLPEHVEARKLEILSDTFEKSLGEKVSIHRAGRWGGGERTSSLLAKLGIEVDLSPSTGYSDARSGGPNFTNLDGSPFWSGDQGDVLTVPASSVNYLKGPQWLSSMAFEMARNWPSLQSRVWRRGKPVRFSPENADEATLFAMAKELGLRNLPTAVYTLHSTSLYAGGNPYSVGNGKADALRLRSLKFLSRAIELKLVKPTTCAALLARAKNIKRIE